MIDIPNELYEYSTGKPFENCLICNRFLLNDKVEYIVEKAYRKHPDVEAEEVIFDYAICQHCANNMMQELSSESMANIQMYFAENVSPEKLGPIPSDKRERIQYMLNHCMVKGTPKTNTQEYQVVAKCKGHHLQQNSFPIMLSFDALDELTELLSTQTQDTLNNFRDQFFPVPPEFEDLFKSRPVLVV